MSSQKEAPDERPPVVLTPVVASAPAGFRVHHMMYAVVACALLAWVAKVAGLGAVVALVVMLVAVGVAMAVVLARRNAAQQESLLWALAVAAERSLPLSPAALAFADHYGRAFRWRAQLFASLLDDGVALPEALDQVPALLSREAQVLVRTGWATGALGRSLREAGAIRSARQDAWGSAAFRFLYLGGVFLTFQSIAGFILYFIAPKLEAIFNDFGLPLPAVTALTLGAGHAVMVEWWPLTALVVTLEVIGVVLLPFGLFNVFQWDIPALDSMFRRRHTTLVFRALGLAVEGGQPLPAALEALAANYPSRWVRRRLRLVADDVRRGGDWVRSLEARGLCRPTDAAVLASAERAGNLAWALRETAESNDRRTGYRVQVWLQALFPLLLLAMGALVFVFAVAYFAPLVRLIERLSG